MAYHSCHFLFEAGPSPPDPFLSSFPPPPMPDDHEDFWSTSLMLSHNVDGPFDMLDFDSCDSDPSPKDDENQLSSSSGGSYKRAYPDPYEDGDGTACCESFLNKRAKTSSPESVLYIEDEDGINELGRKPAGADGLCTDQPQNICDSATKQVPVKIVGEQRQQISQPESTRLVRGGVGRPSGSQTSKGREARWAEHLLGTCAYAIASGNAIRTQHLLWVLNDLASFSGDANQRLAAYGLKALFCKLRGAINMPLPLLPWPLNPNSIAPRSMHRALLRFHDASPWHRAVYTIANGAALEACEGHDAVHIVDIGISQGIQWPTFIEALATRPSGPPKIMRLTTVQESRDSFLSVGNDRRSSGSCSNEFVSRLQPFAKALGLELELRNVQTPLECLTRDDLGLVEGDALVICGQFRLHQIADEYPDNRKTSCEMISPRDAFLRFIRSLHPDAFVLSENDADHCSSEFLTRFRNVTEYHWRFLDSMNVSFKGQDSEERQIIEAQAGLALVNNVVFEGTRRTERNETHSGWSTRMRRAGFCTCLPSAEVLENAKSLLKKYDDNWDLPLLDDCMVMTWKEQLATFCSVWRTTQSVPS